MAEQKDYANSILQSLPSRELHSVIPDLTHADLVKGSLLFERDVSTGNVYFPLTAVISFIGNTGGGGSLEVWSVGREGLAGIAAIFGRTKPFTGVVQIGGAALALKA